MGKQFVHFLLFFFIGSTLNAQKAKPNIVLIFADDLGYKDCGFTSNAKFETPAIDSLAKQGMVFNNAYASAGNCAPSRACLISGMYTPRHGVYAVGSTTRGPKNQMRLKPVANTGYLAASFETIAEALKKQGYATGIFGKWHLNSNSVTGTEPTEQGFDVYADSRKNNPNKKRDEPTDPKGIFSNTQAAIEFMQLNKGRPFFAYVSYHAIHSSLEAKPQTIEYFKQKGMNNKDALYAACVYNLDEGVKLLLDFLKQSGLGKNTLVVFTSDNGATQQSPQEPLRGSKGCYYEGGIREPFIAWWPGVIAAGTQNNTPIINLDLYPTFLSVAGNNKIKPDGENLLPLFTGKSSATKRNSIFWYFPGYLNDPVIRGRDSIFRSRPVTAMRKGSWKILLYHEEWLLDGGLKKIDVNNAVELYNLKDDEGERHNLALVNKKKRNKMLKELLAWMKATGAKWPSFISNTNIPDDSDGANDEN